MPRPFRLPDLGEGLSEAEIVKVLVQEGDVIAEDAPLLEVETDKAQVEIPSPMGGRVETVHVRPGQTVHVGEVLITFGDGAATTAPRAAGSAAPPGPGGARIGASTVGAGPSAAPTERGHLGSEAGASSLDGRGDSPARASDGPGHPADGVPRAAAGSEAAAARELLNIDRPSAPAAPGPIHAGPVPATPATRRLARELGVDLRAVRATGPAGRVTDADVHAAAAAAPGAARREAPSGDVREGPADERVPPSAPPPEPPKPLASVGLEPPPLPRFEQWGPIERQPLSHLRRTIAERMTLSATLIPHVTHFDRVDITELERIVRTNEPRARERGVYLTLTSFILKATALALRAHPRFNASLDPTAGEIILKRYCHLGVAVATERGLIVPVIRDVDRKPILALARELAALATRVRDGKATLEDLRGGTFTVTNIGALGGTGAIPIINYPEVAILGVARGREEPAVRDGQIVPRLLLPITLTFDHRIADGADGARLASEIVRLLEHPDQLLLEL